MLKEVRRRGHQVGLHASYRACSDAEALTTERLRLERQLGEPVRRSRQHYLRFEALRSWQALEIAGIAEDYSLGYADHAGFRAGTAHPFRAYDLDADRPLRLIEHPLVAMDASLMRHEYQGLSVDEAERVVRHLAKRCKAVGGEFTLLWHNSALAHGDHRWAALYRKTLAEVSEIVTDSV